jgi:hypothetical protein
MNEDFNYWEERKKIEGNLPIASPFTTIAGRNVLTVTQYKAQKEEIDQVNAALSDPTLVIELPHLVGKFRLRKVRLDMHGRHTYILGEDSLDFHVLRGHYTDQQWLDILKLCKVDPHPALRRQQ